MVQTALFDVDGTLLDSTKFIWHAFEKTLRTHDGPIITWENLRVHIGRPLREIYRDIAPRHDANILAATHDDLQKNMAHLSERFPHVLETLQTLSGAGIKLAAVSNRSGNVHDTLAHNNIDHFFDAIITSDDVVNLKPHPESLYKALELLDADTAHSVIVGDSPADIEAGKRANLETIGVLYGFHGDVLRTSNPDHVVSKFRDIVPIILRDK